MDLSTHNLLTQGWTTIETPSLDSTLIGNCYAEWSEFFRSSDREKFSARDGQLDGYFRMNSEKAVGAVLPDPKEFFHFYRDGLCPDSCATTTREVFDKVSEIAVSTLSQLAEELPVLKNFTEKIAHSNRLVLRISRYSGESAKYFNAPHDDIDFISILPRATKIGFEVLENGIWKGVMAAPNQCIALCGEMLTEATAGQIKPLRHRVASSAGERYSMSYFLNPDDDVQLSSRWKAGDMLKDRLREIYL